MKATTAVAISIIAIVASGFVFLFVPLRVTSNGPRAAIVLCENTTTPCSGTIACVDTTNGLFWTCVNSSWTITADIVNAVGSSGSTGAANSESGATGAVGSSGSTGTLGISGATGSKGTTGASGATPNNIRNAQLVSVGFSGNIDPNCGSLYATSDFVVSTRYLDPTYCLPVVSSASALRGVAYSSELTLWVAVGGPAFTPKSLTSRDGYVWYNGNGTPNITDPQFIVWASGIFLVGGSDSNGNDLFWTSTDGLTFVSANSNIRTLGFTNMKSAVYSINEQRWIAVGDVNTIVAAVTPAGPWTVVHTAPSGTVLNAVCYSVPHYTWMVVGNQYTVTAAQYTGPFVSFNNSVHNYLQCAYGNNVFLVSAIDITNTNRFLSRSNAGNLFYSTQGLQTTTFWFYGKVVYSNNYNQWAVARTNPFTQDTFTTILSLDSLGNSWTSIFGPGINLGIAYVR